MSEVIEHRDSGNPPPVRVGDGDSSVSVKVYQDVYHQVTGRTEQIRKRYSQNLLIDFSEMEQLHLKITQLCDVLHIVAKNEVVSVFHTEERKEQFTSFERFKAYNANASSPTVNVVLKYNFSIIPAGLRKPQEYVVTVRLTSRVAMWQQFETEGPSFVRRHVLRYMAGDNAAEVTIDYADYVVARGFLEAFAEWVRGCKSEPDIPWIVLLQRWSHIIPTSLKLVAATGIAFFALRATPTFITGSTDPQLWARFLILFGGGFYLITNIAYTAGRIIEDAIDSFSVISYLNLNKGDEKLISEFSKKKERTVWKFCGGLFLTLVLGVASSMIANII